MNEHGSGPATISPAWPIGLAIAAAVLAPVSELLTGHPLPYLLVLTILAGGIWGLARLRRHEMGFRRGTRNGYALAAVYPFLVCGILALLAWGTGRTRIEPVSIIEFGQDLLLMFASTWIGTLITEEGFFRGALWGLGKRAGWTSRGTLWWTSLAFMAWHVAVPIIEKDFQLPAWQIPIYLVNVLLLGLAWGLLRLMSGSVFVAVTAHAVWNALVYVLFGYGAKTKLLGIDQIGLFDPERGMLGLVINAVVVMVFWRRISAARSAG